jgi:hypothetical protein
MPVSLRNGISDYQTFWLKLLGLRGFETQKHTGKAKKYGHKARGPGEAGGIMAGLRNTWESR